jgi:hypothetical protein
MDGIFDHIVYFWEVTDLLLFFNAYGIIQTVPLCLRHRAAFRIYNGSTVHKYRKRFQSLDHHFLSRGLKIFIQQLLFLPTGC